MKTPRKATQGTRRAVKAVIAAIKKWWDREQCKRFDYIQDTEHLTDSTHFGPITFDVPAKGRG